MTTRCAVSWESALEAESTAASEPAGLAWRRAACGVSLGLAAYASLRLGAQFPAFTDRWYSQGFFRYLSRALSSVTRLLPVSTAELGLFCAGVALVVLVLRDLRQLRAGRAGILMLLGRRLLDLCALAGLLYALFVGLWGLNHSRLPYAEHASLQLQAVESAELERLLLELVGECNREVAAVLPADLRVPPSGVSNDSRLERAFGRLGLSVPALAGGRSANLRRPWSSGALSALGISGIYSPFTGEAHLNAELPLAAQPFTACHEEAHGRGFAREDEANFIAWQACREADSAAFRYSGAYVALNLVHRALWRIKPEVARSSLQGLDERVLRDRDESRSFWDSKRTQATHVARRTNDLYLKSQGQAAGTASYGRMLDLLLAERRRDGPLAER
ncbi:MAG: hypothetical protein ACI8QC_000642 [Planctomycetota bacterium]